MQRAASPSGETALENSAVLQGGASKQQKEKEREREGEKKRKKTNIKLIEASRENHPHIIPLDAV